MVGLNCLEHHVLNLSERKLGICRITVLESLQRKKILALFYLMERGKIGTSDWNTGADEFRLESR